MLKWVCGLAAWIISGEFSTGFTFFLLGWLLDVVFLRPKVTVHRSSFSNPQVFTKHMLIFTAAIMKADGHLYKVELDYVKNYLLHNIGQKATSEALLELRDILQQDYDLQTVCSSYSRSASSSEKLLMLRFLFGLANADGQITSEELQLIKYISDMSGIPPLHYESVKAMYIGGYGDFGGYSYQGQSSSSSSSSYSRSTLENDYRILEISSTATDEEVKKAYRRLAKEHHPDKVAHLGEEMRKAAEEKFAKLNQAYERIKSARGMK